MIEDLFFGGIIENCFPHEDGEGDGGLKCIAIWNQIFREYIECVCVVNSNDNVENGLEPYDCSQMEEIYFFEVSWDLILMKYAFYFMLVSVIIFLLCQQNRAKTITLTYFMTKGVV